MSNDIFRIIRDGNELAVQSWLDNIENDFNISDEHGFSLVHWCAWDGHLSLVEMLIRRGAKLNSLNNCNDTPLHCAVQNGHFNVTIYLIKHKADVNAKNSHGNTPLHYAAHFSHGNIALELIKNGAFLMACNKYDRTPLDLSKDPLTVDLINFAKANHQSLDIRIPFVNEFNMHLNRKAIHSSNFINQSTGIDISELSTHFLISSNSSEQLWKGTWRNSDVLIRILQKKEINQRIVNNFNQEYKKLKIFNCANILPVIASTINEPHLIVLSKYLAYGPLFNILHDNGFAIDIAKGMSFLHTLDTKLTNFHLNSHNVMIDEDLTAKVNIADCKFTFCEKFKIYQPAWMSPETLTKKPEDVNKFAADMWSFAIVLFEMHAKQIPFAQYSPMQCGLMIANEGLRIQLSQDLSPQIQKLIKICMNEDVGKRPTFDMILPILEKFKKELISKSK